MTTTTVTDYQSTYNTGIRHVFFDGSASTATSGDFWRKGWCEWHVFYPGSTTPDESYYQTRRFSYVCTLPGTYTFKYRAIDDGGNAGSWVETTVEVLDESLADYIQYVDTADGDDGNTGVSDNEPVQTLNQAVINIYTNWTTSGTHVIYIKRGQTPFGYPIGNGGHTAIGRLMFRPWGDGVSRATMKNTFGDINVGTGQVSYVVWDVDVEFFDSGFPNGKFSLDSGVTRNAPYDFILKDCTISNADSNIVSAADVERSEASRDAHTFSFVAIDNVTLQSPYALFAIYGFSMGSLLHFVDVTVDGLNTGSTSHSIRGWNWSDVYIRGCYFDAQAPTGSDLRFPAYAGTGVGAATRRITIANSKVLGGSIYSHEAENDLYYVRDIECVNTMGIFTAGYSLSGFGGSWDADEIVNRNCYGSGEYSLNLHASSGNVGEIAYEGCLFLRDYSGGKCVNLVGAHTRYGSLYFRNCIFYWDASGNPDGQTAIYAGSMSTAQLAGILGECNYNVAVTADSDSISWTIGESLASWQAATVHDDNSASATSTAPPFTSLKSATNDWNPHLTSSSNYLTDKGGDATYAIDMDGKLRIGDYPGPDDPEATTSPDVPTLDSGSAPVRSTFQNLDRGSCATRTASLGGLLL